MSDISSQLRFAASHEWARLEADGSISVGISNHAQEALGDVVYVELPEVGRTFAAQEQPGVVESVRAASDIYAPVAGSVVAVNEALADSPELINEAPYEAWIYRLQPVSADALAELMDADAYSASVNA